MVLYASEQTEQQLTCVSVKTQTSVLSHYTSKYNIVECLPEFEHATL